MIKKAFLLLLLLINLHELSAQQLFSPSALSTENLILGDLEWGDFDKDGDQDLLAMGVDGNNVQQVILYENNAGVFTAVNTTFQGVQNGTCSFIDFDNDNDLDIFISGASGATFVTRTYENVNGSFQEVDLGLADASFTTTKWIDMDLDGDQDLLLTGWNANYVGTTTLYINHLDTFLVDSNSIFPTVNFGALDATDLDKDGQVDLVLAGSDAAYAGYTQLFEYNTDSARFVADTNQNLEGLTSVWVRFFDFDQDGDDDLFTLGSDTNYDARLTVYQNNNGLLNPIQSFISPGFGYTKDPFVVGDLNNDGAPDLLLAGYNDNYDYLMQYFINQQDTLYQVTNAGLPLFGGNSSFALYDVDHDLDLDFAFAGYDDATIDPVRIQLFNNDSAATNTPPTVPTVINTSVDYNQVALSWSKATDAETAQNGLTYNLSLQNTVTGKYINSPNSLPNGTRMITARGNMKQDTSVIYSQLEPGIYNWQIQSLDNSFVASDFSPIESFVITDLTPFSLLSPANGMYYSIDPDANSFVDFTWEKSANSLYYKWYFADENYTTLLSKAGSTDTTQQITHEEIYALAASNGHPSEGYKDYFWWVEAYGQYDSLVSIDTFQVTFKLEQHPKSFELMHPAQNDTLVLDINQTSPIEFKWHSSEGANTYHFNLTDFNDLTYANPFLSRFSLTDTTLSFNESDLALELTAAGYTIGSFHLLRWRTTSTGNYFSTPSAQDRSLVVKIIDSSVSVEEHTAKAPKCYPIPFTHQVIIEFAQIEAVHHVSIFDITGKHVLSISPNTPTLSVNTAEWPAGIYFVKTQFDHAVTTQQIIKN